MQQNFCLLLTGKSFAYRSPAQLSCGVFGPYLQLGECCAAWTAGFERTLAYRQRTHCQLVTPERAVNNPAELNIQCLVLLQASSKKAFPVQLMQKKKKKSFYQKRNKMQKKKGSPSWVCVSSSLQCSKNKKMHFHQSRSLLKLSVRSIYLNTLQQNNTLSLSPLGGNSKLAVTYFGPKTPRNEIQQKTNISHPFYSSTSRAFEANPLIVCLHWNLGQEAVCMSQILIIIQ